MLQQYNISKLSYYSCVLEDDYGFSLDDDDRYFSLQQQLQITILVHLLSMHIIITTFSYYYFIDIIKTKKIDSLLCAVYSSIYSRIFIL